MPEEHSLEMASSTVMEYQVGDAIGNVPRSLAMVVAMGIATLFPRALSGPAMSLD